MTAISRQLASSAGELEQTNSPKGRGGILRSGFWAVADQGLFAGSNFIVGVVLANWLSVKSYGAFATALAVFLMLGVVHTAVLTEPMLVFAPDRYKARLGQYLGALIPGHIIVSLLASLGLVIYGMYWKISGMHAVTVESARQANELANAMFCFAGSAPFVLFLWLMRRSCYAQLQPRRAAMAGIGYLVLMMIALFIVHVLGALSIGSALAMMGGSSLLAGLWIAAGSVELRRLPRELLKDVALQHWRYGRWATATQLMGFLPGNIYYFLLPKIASVEQSGALLAISNLYKPFVQANAALCLMLLPVFVRTQGTPEGKRMHRLALLALAGGPLLYWLVLGLANRQIIDLMYQGKYQEYSRLLWIIGLQPVILGMSGIYGSLLRARQKMNAVFWGGFVAAAAAVGLGLTLTMKLGMTGVCWSIVLTSALHHVTLWLFSREFTRRSAVNGASAPDLQVAMRSLESAGEVEEVVSETAFT